MTATTVCQNKIIAGENVLHSISCQISLSAVQIQDLVKHLTLARNARITLMSQPPTRLSKCYWFILVQNLPPTDLSLVNTIL
jgi:hypothetical protein